MRIASAQINPIIGDLKGNCEKIIAVIKQVKGSADMVVFPELALCGYPPEDLLLHQEFIDAIPSYLDKIVQASQGIVVIVGTVRKNLSDGEKPIYNSAAIIQDQKLLGFHDKWLLPTYDVFDERRYFEMGKSLQTWEFFGKKVAVLICEDMWQHAGYVGWTRYPCDPINELIDKKPDLVINISSSPYHFQKPEQRFNVCAKAAKTLKCPVLLCCQVGANDQLIFDGYSMYVTPPGNLSRLAKGFEVDVLWVDDQEEKASLPNDHWGDLYRALVLGVRDYFHKQGFTKACLGLSGGIDSALVACIAKEALGKENILAVSMPSRFSSEGSKTDAALLCKNLQIPMKEISIEGPFESFLNLLEPCFEKRAPDVTEENIQARIRGMVLMALSNKLGYLVVSTGNKSELALGYCTLYGDMCGGLSVIADVLKTQVYGLANWINKDKEIIPRSTIEKAPSAELRHGQKDTDTLPDYALVDVVLQAYIEDFLSPDEIIEKYKVPAEVVHKIIRMIHLAEYKRRQSPPGLRISRKAFRVGRRFPIVQKWV